MAYRGDDTFSTAPYTSAIHGHQMDVAEAGSWMGGCDRSSGSGEVMHHISECSNFTNAFTSPMYPYKRDALIVNEQLEHFYHDESPSNREVRRLLGDPDDREQRDILVNCLIRHQWQCLGVWNHNWGTPGLPGYRNEIANWKWKWREEEDQSDFLAADRVKRQLTHIWRAARMALTLTPSCKQICLTRNATVAEAEEYLSSRPWFVHGVQVQAMRTAPLVGKGDRLKAIQRVQNAWMLQGKWASEWDHYDPGWRWGGDDMTINPQFLLNLLSDNEKKALGLQDNQACSLRHRGHYSLSAGQSRSSDTRYDETPRGQTSNQGSPDIGHNPQGTNASEHQHEQQPKESRPQTHTGYQRFSEAYFARGYSPFGERPATSSAADPGRILVDEDNGEEISAAISPLAPRIQVSIENFNLGLSPAQFSL